MAKKKVETTEEIIEEPAEKKNSKKEPSAFDMLDELIQQQFDEVVDLSKVDGKVRNWYDTGIYSLNYSMSKNLRFGIPAGRITSYTGLSGCLFDNTIIKINRGKRTGIREYTIKEIAEKIKNNKWNKSIQSNTFSYKKDLDCISYNEILEVIDSGDKECFELITENGKSIIVSKEHPFKAMNPGNRGIVEKDSFVALKDLVVGEEIMVKSKSDSVISFGGRSRGRREISGIEYHPHAWKKITDIYSYKRSYFSRLVVEADMNSLSVSDYINTIKYDEKKARQLKYLLPDQIVHHKNGNVLDDVIENLVVLTKEEHDGLHSGLKGFRGFGNNEYHYEKIKSILSVGIKHTYDIRMKEPYSNFVANDIVVHNTGKSLLAASAMKDPQLDMIIVVETEGGGHAKELIEFAGVNPNKVRILKANTFASYKINKKNNKIEEISDDKFPVKKDTPENFFVEGATRMIKRFVNALDFTPRLKESKILIILDSLGNLQSVRELAGGFDMGKRAQDIGSFFRTFDVAFEKTNIAFLYTNKLYTNLANQWDPWKETGGVNVEYNPSLSIRFADSAATDDKSDAEIIEEKERRKTSLGSSIKTIRATVTKSRFGTEMRNSWFLLDFMVGPVRLSGLFTLLSDFEIITGTRTYSIEGWNNGKAFYKKDFLNLVLKNEQTNINFFQKKLEEAELNIKQKKLELQVNDLSETLIQDEEDADDVDSMGSMMMHMEKDAI